MSRPQDWILPRQTVCWSCLTDCTGRGIRWCSSHTMSGQRSAPQDGCILKTGAFSGEIIRHRITGALEPHRRFTLSGRRVFRLNQAESCALRSAGDCRARGFSSSLNSCLSLIVSALQISPCYPQGEEVKRVKPAGVYPPAPPPWVRRIACRPQTATLR